MLFRKYKKMSMQEAQETIPTIKGLVLLDVRTKPEYKEGHIPNAKNIPLNDMAQVVDVIKDKQTPLYVYCQSGMRSANACSKLHKLGYQDVTNIGGLTSWTGSIHK